MRTRIVGPMLAPLAALWLGLSLHTALAADYMSSARDALRKGDLRTAQIELRNAVRSDPQNAEARFLLAQVQLQMGEPAAAERQAREAQARGFDKLRTTPLIGQALLMQNRAGDLLNEFKPTGTDPKLDAEILVDRGAAQVAQGDAESARKSFAEAQKLNPKNLAAWLAGARLAIARHELTEAATQVDQALALDAKSVDARVLKAQLLAQDKDFPGALKLLDATITDSPPALAARLLRANLMLAQNKVAEAKADDEAVLALQPANVEALYIKAVLLHQAKDDQAADALLQRLAPMFDRLPRAYYLQALVRQGLGQTELAASSISKYVARVPDDLNGVKLLAQLESARGRPDLALEPLRNVVANGHADAQTLEILARVSFAVGQRQAALDALRKAVAMAPKETGLRAQLGAMLMDTGQPDAAISELEGALAEAPQSPQLAEALFLAALKTGSTERAAAALVKIRGYQGDTPLVQNLDGLLKMAQLDLAGARSTFEAILRTNPDFAPARVNLARVLGGQGDTAQYDKLLRGMLEKNPASQPALGMLAERQVSTGHLDQAVKLYQQAHAAAPEDAAVTQTLGKLLIQAGTPQKALDLIAPAAPGGTVETQFLGLQAAAQVALKQTDQARATLTQIVAEQPRNLAARRQLVLMLVEAKDYEGARNTVKAGIAALPDAYQLRLDYALIDLKASGIKAAVTTAEALSHQDSANAALRALPGDVYMAAEQPAEAVAAYQEALAAAPSQALVLRLAGAQQRAGKNDEAYKTLTAWYSAHPADLAVAEALSSHEIATGKYAAAKVYLQAILAKAPRDPGSLNNLAWVDQKLGDKGAKALAQQAYLLAPSPQTADTLGWILTTGGEAATGAVLLRQASAGSKDPRIHYHLAVALKDTGDRAQAMKLLQGVVAVPGEFEEKAAAQKLLTELTKGS